MNIGTAKPDPDLLREFPHRLIDIRDPWERYSAGDFVPDALAAIREITAAGSIPLLVGGTMLYFRALQRGLADLPAADAKLRAQLDARAAREGWPALHAELRELDPVAAARLQPSDSQRIQRALEVCLLTGSTLSALQQSTRPPATVDYLNVGLLPADRSVLHERIRVRFEAMLAAGFVAEVRALQALPEMTASVPAMRSVGYRQIWPHAAGEADLASAAAAALAATRGLAKRQLTWLRKWPELHAIDSLSAQAEQETCQIIHSWLEVGASPDISR
jgi:tRNA dimethylallyltransferase